MAAPAVLLRGGIVGSFFSTREKITPRCEKIQEKKIRNEIRRGPVDPLDFTTQKPTPPTPFSWNQTRFGTEPVLEPNTYYRATHPFAPWNTTISHSRQIPRTCGLKSCRAPCWRMPLKRCKGMFMRSRFPAKLEGTKYDTLASVPPPPSLPVKNEAFTDIQADADMPQSCFGGGRCRNRSAASVV